MPIGNRGWTTLSQIGIHFTFAHWRASKIVQRNPLIHFYSVKEIRFLLGHWHQRDFFFPMPPFLGRVVSLVLGFDSVAHYALLQHI